MFSRALITSDWSRTFGNPVAFFQASEVPASHFQEFPPVIDGGGHEFCTIFEVVKFLLATFTFFLFSSISWPQFRLGRRCWRSGAKETLFLCCLHMCEEDLCSFVSFKCRVAWIQQPAISLIVRAVYSL